MLLWYDTASEYHVIYVKYTHFYGFRLQFRTLVRSYDCDICFTPMILADSFKISDKARNNEFTTNLCRYCVLFVHFYYSSDQLLVIAVDVPLITQFAANNADDFVTAGCMVSQ